MIAFTLHELGLDPAFLIGGEVPQLGGNAGTGEGMLVVEGDESDRTIELLRPRIAVVLNVDLDHHSRFASRAEVEELFERWLEHVPEVVRGDELEPVDFQLDVPGEHNRRNAAARARGPRARRRAARGRGRPACPFGGVGRRLETRGEARGVTLIDDYAHNPAKVEAALAAARERHPDARRPGAVPAAPVLAHPSPGPRVRLVAGDGRCRGRHGHLSGPRGAAARRDGEAAGRRAGGAPARGAGRLDARASRTAPPTSPGARGPAT